MQPIINLAGHQWKARDGLWNVAKNEKVSNAIPVLKRRVRYVSPEGETVQEEFLLTFLYNSGSEDDEVVISAKDLRTGKFIESLPIDVAIYEGYSKKIAEIYRLCIQEQMIEHPVEKIILYELGWNGKKYFWGTTEENIFKADESEAYPIAMELARLLGADECVAGVFIAASHGPMIPLLSEAGIKHNFVTYVVGETGVGKSDLVKKLCDYDSQRPVFLSLGSDKRALKKVTIQLSDKTVVIDDFCKSESTRVLERQKDALSEIIQGACNAGKLLLPGMELSEKGGEVHVVVTGEKLINNISTLNRCFLLSMDEKLPDDVWKALDVLSESKGIRLFMYFFLVWVQDNYDDIVRRMRTNYRVYSDEVKAKLRCNVPGIERIRATVAVQLTLRKCILDYLAHMRIDDGILQQVTYITNVCCWNGGKDMCDYILGLKNEKSKLKYLPTLAGIIIGVGNGAWVANSEEVYQNYVDRKGRDGDCIGVRLNKGYLSFSPRRMCELISAELGGEPVTPKSISTELKYYSLVYVDSEGKMSCRWHSQKRLYHVRIKELVELTYPGLLDANEVVRRIWEDQ